MGLKLSQDLFKKAWQIRAAGSWMEKTGKLKSTKIKCLTLTHDIKDQKECSLY